MTLADLPLAVIDLEMTGLNPSTDAICEVAIVLAQGGEEQGTFQSLVRPTVPVSAGARAVHGLSDAELEVAPPFRELAPDIAKALEGRLLIAHNARFDLSFLKPAMAEAGYSLAPERVIDSLHMARRLFRFKSNRLSAVAEHFGVTAPTHRALDDARTTLAIFHAMLNLFDPAGELSYDAFRQIIDSRGRKAPEQRETLAVLEQGLKERRSVWIDYLAMGVPVSQRQRREVEVRKIRLPRFEAWCHLRQAKRVFRLDRVFHAELGDRHYEL